MLLLQCSHSPARLPLCKLVLLLSIALSTIPRSTSFSCGTTLFQRPIHKLATCCIFSSRPTQTEHVKFPSKATLYQQATARKSASLLSSSLKDMCTSHPLALYNFPEPLLLGSASFTRKLILQEMGIPYHVVVRPIDEKGLGDRDTTAPSELVLTLAVAKMNHLVQEIQAGRCHDDLPSSTSISENKNPSSTTSWIVLTGDQVVVCDGKILEKPESIDEARMFVSKYATSPPSTVGSCVLTHLPSGVQVSGVDTATVHFRPSLANTATAGQDLIDRLLAEEAPILSCAGGLMVEHPLVKEHIDRIEGTEDSVLGLSKHLVLKLLKQLSDKLTQAGIVP